MIQDDVQVVLYRKFTALDAMEDYLEVPDIAELHPMSGPMKKLRNL